MKRIFAAALGLLAFAGVTATAADLPRYQPVAPVYNPVYYWTGFYIGINGGGINKFDLSGGLIGGTIGYNWQVGQIVVGAEGDIDWSGVKGTTTALCAAGCETRNKWLATVHGRLSIDNDRATIDKLWNRYVAAWFEGGKDDPKLALLRLDAERAEIWVDASST